MFPRLNSFLNISSILRCRSIFSLIANIAGSSVIRISIVRLLAEDLSKFHQCNSWPKFNTATMTISSTTGKTIRSTIPLHSSFTVHMIESLNLTHNYFKHNSEIKTCESLSTTITALHSAYTNLQLIIHCQFFTFLLIGFRLEFPLTYLVI